MFVKVASGLLAVVLCTGCAATEWFSAPGVELRECSAKAGGDASEPVSPSSGGELSSSVSESFRGAWSSLLDGTGGDGDVARVDGLVSGVDDAAVRELLFDGDDADRVVGALEKFPDDSAFLDRSAAVAVGRLNSGEELTHSDKRVMGTVFARVGARGAYTALQGGDVADQARQLVAIGTKRGVGERFVGCAVIGEGLAGDERVVLDAVMKASAEAGVSEDGRQWLLNAMVARADDVFTTLSDGFGRDFDDIVRVGATVTEDPEAQHKLVYAMRDAYRDALNPHAGVEQPNSVYFNAARGLGAAVEMISRSGQHVDSPRTAVARVISYYRYIYCAKYNQTSCPNLPEMPVVTEEWKERPGRWATIGRLNLSIVIANEATNDDPIWRERKIFNEYNSIIVEAVSKGERAPRTTENEAYRWGIQALRFRGEAGAGRVQPYELEREMTSSAGEAAGVIATMDKAS